MVSTVQEYATNRAARAGSRLISLDAGGKMVS